MNGQWVAHYEGARRGILIVDLDDLGDRYQGCANFYDRDRTYPGWFAAFRTADKSRRHVLQLNLAIVDLLTNEPMSAEFVAAHFSNLNIPTSAEVTLDFSGDLLTLNVTTNSGEIVASTRPGSILSRDPSVCVPNPSITTWRQFKEYVTSLEHRRFIFRGQREPWRLRTTFHRRGRADISRFREQDVPALQRYLSSKVTHSFDLTVAQEYGAFLNLVQHHGYPTPLLDCTYSPFVAAFFAYRGVPNETPPRDPEPKIRIFIFDKRAWETEFLQRPGVTKHGLTFSVLEFMAYENARLIPQQSVSLLSSIDDIEGYIQAMEKDRASHYLQVIDLPHSERQNVMRELSLMGVTAGALFPGLDGACEDLRERFF